MTSINILFFELIQVAIGTRICLSHTPSADEWGKLYAMAKKQSLVGVCFAGVQKLQNQESSTQNPQPNSTQNREPRTQNLDEVLYLTWMGMAAKIQQRNEVVNRQCVDLQKRLSDDGLRSCILKGQGVAALYGEQLRNLRQSGDIDIWVEGGFESVNEWVQSVSPTREINMHHIQLDVFDDTEVEVHYVPFIHHNPFKQKILRAFYDDKKNACMKNGQPDELVAPTIEFNLVFLLLHIFHHFFTEGVGMRQVMDYHFAVKHEMEVEKDSNVQEVKKVISDLGLERFASALMWVIGYVFDQGMLETWLLKPETALWKPNEKDGRIVLERIMAQGNFGKQSDDNLVKMGLADRAWHRLKMSACYYRFDHGYWFWGPYDGIKTKLWQMKHGY